MSYPPALAAALGGVTQHQLKHWRAEPKPILRPEGRGRPVRYSFRDLLAIRTFGALRTEVSMQKVRKAVENLHKIEDVEHLSNYKLVTDGTTIMWIAADDAVDLLKRPGQRVLAVMRDVLDTFESRTGQHVVPLLRPARGVVVDAEILSGFPVVEGTRIPYDTIAGLVSDRVPPESIRYFYPSVSDEGISGAVALDDYVSGYNSQAA